MFMNSGVLIWELELISKILINLIILLNIKSNICIDITNSEKKTIQSLFYFKRFKSNGIKTKANEELFFFKFKPFILMLYPSDS